VVASLGFDAWQSPTLRNENGSLEKNESRDLRGVERFPLTLPVYISWPTRGRATSHGLDMTKDISSLGMFVSSHTIPRAGTAIRFEFRLGFDDFPFEMIVAGVGRVVRSTQDSTHPESEGFAILNQSIHVWDPKDESRPDMDAADPMD
jgi:hypothetical protein